MLLLREQTWPAQRCRACRAFAGSLSRTESWERWSKPENQVVTCHQSALRSRANSLGLSPLLTHCVRVLELLEKMTTNLLD